MNDEWWIFSRNPERWRHFCPQRCCRSLVWAHQTSLPPPSWRQKWPPAGASQL